MSPLPQEFLSCIEQYPLLEPLKLALETAPETSIRINRAKLQGSMLPILKDSADQVLWNRDGYYLSERPNFTFDPALHQGLYYVQDASSMAIASAIEELCHKMGNMPVSVLDACAAPGGKTTAMLSVLPEGSAAIANEYDFKRASVLAENIAKWGFSNIAVSKGDTHRLSKMRACFDIALVDAPCSGEGMMRKDDKARQQWTSSLVSSCTKTQREILENVWPTLRPGAFLVYSTCTFNRHENEEQLRFLVEELGGMPVALQSLDNYSQISHGIDTDWPCYRFLPGRVRGEGLFLCVVQKPGVWQPNPLLKSQKGIAFKDKEIMKWLKGDLNFECINDDLFTYPAYCQNLFLLAKKHLDIISIGTLAASIKGREYQPAHQLALSLSFDKAAFPSVELDYETSIKYLRREAISIDCAHKGIVLLTYKNNPLGFVKNLGNRANNLYPKHWRIISNFL